MIASFVMASPKPACKLLRLAFVAMLGAGAACAGEKQTRVVTAGGAITEVVYAIGARQRLVGVDTTSLHPPEALKTHPNVGYLRALSAEGVLSLSPDLVIASAQAGPPAVLDILRAAGVRIEMIPEPDSQEVILSNIARVGKLMERESAAAKLEAEVRGKFEQLEALRGSIAKKKRVLFVLSLQNGRALAAGRNTSAHLMMQLSAAANAGEQFEGYKAMTDEAIIQAAPDAILTMSRAGAGFDAGALFAMPAFAATPAGSTKSHIEMDGLFLLGLGPRTPDAALELIGRLYPETVGAKQAAGKP